MACVCVCTLSHVHVCDAAPPSPCVQACVCLAVMRAAASAATACAPAAHVCTCMLACACVCRHTPRARRSSRSCRRAPSSFFYRTRVCACMVGGVRWGGITDVGRACSLVCPPPLLLVPGATRVGASVISGVASMHTEGNGLVRVPDVCVCARTVRCGAGRGLRTVQTASAHGAAACSGWQPGGVRGGWAASTPAGLSTEPVVVCSFGCFRAAPRTSKHTCCAKLCQPGWHERAVSVARASQVATVDS
jgi:hypothetical protein